MLIPMIDYLSFGVKPSDYHDVITLLSENLTACKDIAKQNMINKSSEKATINLNNILFEVLPNGANGYAFILHNAEYQIKLMQYQSTNSNFFPMKVYIKSEVLWAMSPTTAYQNICSWIEELFGTIVATKISRSDLCCHTDLIDFNYENKNAFKGSYRKLSIFENNRSLSGINFGVRESLIYCRIYDKQLEVKEQKKKLWFFEIWNNYGWNNKLVWNIEYELKRDFFSEYDIDTVEDFFSRVKNIWHYCTTEWLVLTNNDRSRIENSTINDEWLKISESFNDFADKSLIKRSRQMKAEAEAILPSALGYLTSYAARINTDDINTAASDILENGRDYLSKKSSDFAKVINEKIDLLTSEKGGENFGKTDIYSKGGSNDSESGNNYDL